MKVDYVTDENGCCTKIHVGKHARWEKGKSIGSISEYNSFIWGLAPTWYESVGCGANAKGALVCDEENFSFPEECALAPLGLSSPRSTPKKTMTKTKTAMLV